MAVVKRKSFNSILVRLKATFAIPPQHAERRFNSILVRLKVVMTACSKFLLPSFNSILVRLKACECPVAFDFTWRFQFHTGSIKSRSRYLMTHGIEFQFHTGSIKSTPRQSIIWILSSSFNSILVRLKGIRSMR